MKHNYLNNTELNEAKEKYFSAVKESGFGFKEETIPIQLSHGRTLAKAVYAKICSPHYNASAMDGIAVFAEDTYGACENEPVVLPPEKYTVVDTGDPMPDGTDAVVMIEDVDEDDSGLVRLISAVHPWQNVRQVGEDICMGDMIAPTGTVVTPSLCGAFLAGGITSVNVKKHPVFGIIPTGDEIVEPKENPEKEEIIGNGAYRDHQRECLWTDEGYQDSPVGKKLGAILKDGKERPCLLKVKPVKVKDYDDDHDIVMVEDFEFLDVAKD